jgi:hypothetical protein
MRHDVYACTSPKQRENPWKRRRDHHVCAWIRLRPEHVATRLSGLRRKLQGGALRLRRFGGIGCDGFQHEPLQHTPWVWLGCARHHGRTGFEGCSFRGALGKFDDRRASLHRLSRTFQDANHDWALPLLYQLWRLRRGNGARRRREFARRSGE